MATLPRVLSLAALSLSIFLVSCGGGTPSTLPVTTPPVTTPTYTLFVSPKAPFSLAVGNTITFTATTNEPSVTWEVLSAVVPLPYRRPGLSDALDLGIPISGTGTTFEYTAPETPPVDVEPGLYAPGTVTVRAIAGDITVDTNFTITAPSITTGFIVPTSPVSIPLGGGVTFAPYVVGSTNNSFDILVNGVSDGSASLGTISSLGGHLYGEYIYQAPATMPATGSTITITVVSLADPTKSSSLIVTLH